MTFSRSPEHRDEIAECHDAYEEFFFPSPIVINKRDSLAFSTLTVYDGEGSGKRGGAKNAAGTAHVVHYPSTTPKRAVVKRCFRSDNPVCKICEGWIFRDPNNEAFISSFTDFFLGGGINPVIYRSYVISEKFHFKDEDISIIK